MHETDVVLNLAHLVVPAPTRRWLRRTYDALRFDMAMKRFSASPGSALAADSNVLSELISAWGNAGWIAQEQYLRSCIAAALVTPGPTLECGSGLSTLLLGVIAQQRGFEHWALEHLPEWCSKVQHALTRHKIHAVRLCSAPLKSYGGYTWYAPPLARMPKAFSFVACDGPPSDTVGGRYGLAPVLQGHLRPGCVILLD